MNISKPKRQFVDTKLVVDSWESIEGYYNNLIQREINSKEDFIYWLRDQSELEAILEEDAAWRYIKMTIDTKDEVLSNAYTFFVANIQPKIAPIEDQLNRKLYASKYIDELSVDPAFEILFRSIKKALDLYREENVSIQSDISKESQKFGALSAAQSIE
jgi:oligoendopeptidase F